MSAIVYIGSTIPEKELIKTDKFKAYLSPSEKEKILKELRISVPDLEDYIVTMQVEIELKKYTTKIK